MNMHDGLSVLLLPNYYMYLMLLFVYIYTLCILRYSFVSENVPHFEGYYNSKLDHSEDCVNVLRHKDILVSEDRMIRFFNAPTVAIQEPGQIVVTFPKGYHGGFNTGFNVNCAINYACKDWIFFGLRASIDLCV
jgi:hypothetical protein